MSGESIAVAAENVMASRFTNAAGLVVLLYDHLLTLDEEVSLIWTAKTSLPKIIFLFNRYIVPAAMILTTNDISGVARQVFSNEYCRRSMGFTTFLGMVTIANTNLLILFRIWVLWQRNFRLICWTAGAFVLAQAGAIVAASLFMVDMRVNINYCPKLYGCCITYKNGYVGLMWVPGLAFEVMVFVLVWWNALHRPSSNASELTKALYRDGCLYFVVLFALRLLNLILGIIAPISLIFLGVFFIWCASTVTTSRFILNLRRVSMRESTNARFTEGIDAPRDSRDSKVPVLDSETGDTSTTTDGMEMRSRVSMCRSSFDQAVSPI